MTKGGEGLSGFKHSEASLLKMSESHKGQPVSKETKEKLRLIMSEAPHRFKAEDLNKPILLYNLKGIFVREYSSIEKAIIGLGKSPTQKHTVFDSLKNPNSKAHGYLWRYKTTDMFPIFIEPYKDPRSKTVYHYSVDGQLLEKYMSPIEASKVTGISVKTIHSSIKWSRKAPRRDYWSYEAPVSQ